MLPCMVCDAGASRGLTQPDGMSNGTNRRRLMLTLRRRRGRLKLIQVTTSAVRYFGSYGGYRCPIETFLYALESLLEELQLLCWPPSPDPPGINPDSSNSDLWDFGTNFIRLVPFCNIFISFGPIL